MLRRPIMPPVWHVVLVLALLLPGAVVAAPTSQGSAPAIRLQAAAFAPAAGQQPAIPPGLAIAGYNAEQRGYYIVQFHGPVQQEWKDLVAAQGAEILDYIPDFAFKVRMNPAEADRIAGLAEVAWVGIFQPAFKLSADLKLEGTNLYRVRVERGANFGLTMAALNSTGVQILGQSENLVYVGADAAQLIAIANVLDVAWVENYVLPEKHNEYGAGVILGANTANASGYDGSTQTVAVADTGIGDGTAAGVHNDIPANRIVSIHNWPGATNICFQQILDDGAIDVDSAHGTHVAGSVLSDGNAAGIGKGTAPAAHLVFQATENWANISNYCQLFGGWPSSGYFLTGLPDDLQQLFQQAYNDGARIHSNSWGSAQAGVYTVDSANADAFVWSNRDMSITFSAGNEGADANNNGLVDNDSIGSPATAKNVITVGASENARADNWPCDASLTYTSHDAYQPGQTCGSMGGINLLGTAGQRWGFTAEPLNSDSTAGNVEQMAPFSSRGPTDDGRIKPDIVAPGTWILSTASSLYQEGYGDPVNPRNGLYQYDGWGMPFNAEYKYMGGTSMSNPIVAGAAAVVRDFYAKAHGHAASAALTKATLINSAVDLLDENNDGANDNDFPIPNVHEGWGRINVARATDNSHQFMDESGGLTTGGNATHTYNIATAGQPLKVTLVWSDYPSTEAAAANLVNDLDLVVTAPTGAIYRGNVFSGGWSQNGGSADRVNNVENVYVSGAEAGVWTVRIDGYNVPNGPQPFALVVDGTFGPLPNQQPVAAFTVNCLELSCTFDGSASADSDGSITNYAWDFGDGSSATDTIPTAQHSYGAAGTYNVTLTVTDNEAATGVVAQAVTVNVASTSIHVADIDGAAVNSGKNWQAQAVVTVHDANHVPIAGALVDGTWSADATGAVSCATDGSGACILTSPLMAKKGTNSAILTVTNVTVAGQAYAAGDNHDPDGDSSGTAIQINKDGTTQNPGVQPNQPPTASFSWDCSGTLTCAFNASGSSDPEGSALTYSWTFGDGGTASEQNPSHTYGGNGTYEVTLTVTDMDGATGTATNQVTAGAAAISLSVTAYKVQGTKQADLVWSGTSAAAVDIYRDATVFLGQTNDGAYTDNLMSKGGGTATYKVCEAGTSTCSNPVTVTW